MLGKLFSKAQDDRVTATKIARQVPNLVKSMPRMAKGFYVANRSQPEKPRGLGVLLDKAANAHPRGIAIAQRDRRISYRELNDWSNRIANYFLGLGLKKGDVVAVMLDNRPELLALAAGLSKTGIICALINTTQRDEVLLHSIQLVKAKVLVVGEEHHDVVNDISDRLGSLRCFSMPDGDCLADPSGTGQYLDDSNLAALVQSQASDTPSALNACFEDDACFYFYTSGTTGLPKAARLTHGRFHKAYWGMGVACVNLGKEDALLATLPFYHATAMVVCWSCVLSGCATLVVERRFSASQFWPIVNQHSVTAIGYVGELCRYLLERPASERDAHNSVRLMIGNGLRPNIWGPFKQRFGIEQVFELYGSSEGNIGFLNVLNLDNTVGFTPLSFAIVEYDVDEEAPTRAQDGFMSRVGPGGTGLLLGEINDQAPFDGYTEKDKTEKTILRNVFTQGDAWFNTGDLVKDLGYRHVQFVDRLGDTFRWKGENVSTTQVENILANCPGIAEAVVYGVEIPHTNGRAGMASIRLEEGATFDADRIHRTLVEALPAYAIPLFIRISEVLERTATFKYRKVDMKKQAYRPNASGDPVWGLLPGEVSYVELSAGTVKKIDAGDLRY